MWIMSVMKQQAWQRHTSSSCRKEGRFGGSFRSGGVSEPCLLMIRAVFHRCTPPLRMLTGLRAETETLLAAPFNPLLCAHFWAAAGAGTIVLTALSSSVRKRELYSKVERLSVETKAQQTPCIYVRVHVCACFCMSVKGCMHFILLIIVRWIDARLWLWESMLIRWRLPLNTIFTAVSATLFQPQVSVHQSPAARLQGWERFPFPVTDRDYNWKRMSRSSKQCSEALTTCLLGCAVMQTSMRRYSEFKCTTKQKSQFLPLLHHLFSWIGRSCFYMDHEGSEEESLLIPFHNTVAHSPGWLH